MKNKLFSLLAIGFVLAVIVGSVKAQPDTHQAHPLSLPIEPIVAPGGLSSDELWAAPAAITSTRWLDPASLTKTGKQDQHSAKAGHQERRRQIYGETDPTSTQPAIYIIQLKDAPLASYRGGVPNLAATSPQVTGASQLDVRSASSRAYRAYLQGKQADFRRAAENELGRSLKVIYQYDVTFNGLAMQLTPQEAKKLVGVEGVSSIQRDQWRYAQTSDTPTFLGVTGIWEGSAGAGTTKG
jgi:hypothetical protein